MDYAMEDAIDRLVAAIDSGDRAGAHEALDRFADATDNVSDKIASGALHHRLAIARARPVRAS